MRFVAPLAGCALPTRKLHVRGCTGMDREAPPAALASSLVYSLAHDWLLTLGTD